MKHFLIFLVLCVTIALAVSYNRARITELGNQLITDAYIGDLLAVKEDLEQGAPLDFEALITDDARNYTHMPFNALHAAASSGNEDLIVYLTQQGLLVDFPTPEGWTPLFIAVRDGQTEAAKLLVYQGADTNIQTNLGATALHMAVTQPFSTEEERLHLITYLLEYEANPHLTDIYNHTPLYYAQQLGKQEVINLLQNFHPTR